VPNLESNGVVFLIGVIPKAGQEGVVEEFFELFKTPWERYCPGRPYDVILATADEVPEVNPQLLLVYGTSAKSMDARIGLTARERPHDTIVRSANSDVPIYGKSLTFADVRNGVPCVTGKAGTAGIKLDAPGSTVIRLGYDLFEQVHFLLSMGQSVENAHIPTLDIHISMLREWILEAGIPLVEIPPVPHGHSFSVCLTHDIDFVGIRKHCFDRTMLGFVYRATVGAVKNFFRGRITATQVLQSWRAVVTLPFVYAGWSKDFWEPFEWYLNVEKGLPATYFLIPFKRRPGDNTPGPRASLRATAYDVGDLPEWTDTLQKQGCEIGVHGIDAWHSVENGREELARIRAVARTSEIGIRMHWLLREEHTPYVLEQAGFDYDSTVGYNETVGYRSGTAQVFLAPGARTLLELPMHIQDGALFYPQKLDLSEVEAEKRCQALVEHVEKCGGVLTVLWHDRSHAPERFWGSFYAQLLKDLKTRNAWFATAGQATAWFRKRRHIRFDRAETHSGHCPRVFYEGEEIQPPIRLRIYEPPYRNGVGTSDSDRNLRFKDISWNGLSSLELDSDLAHHSSTTLPDSTLCPQP